MRAGRQEVLYQAAAGRVLFRLPFWKQVPFLSLFLSFVFLDSFVFGCCEYKLVYFSHHEESVTVPVERSLAGSRNLLNDRIEVGLLALGCVLLGYLVSRHWSQ